LDGFGHFKLLEYILIVAEARAKNVFEARELFRPRDFL
jgi:hypothetical protein